jgi:hypothetical protein
MRGAGYFRRQVYTTPFDNNLSGARVVKRSRQIDQDSSTRFCRRFLKLKAFYYPATYLFWSEGI